MIQKIIQKIDYPILSIVLSYIQYNYKFNNYLVFKEILVLFK